MRFQSAFKEMLMAHCFHPTDSRGWNGAPCKQRWDADKGKQDVFELDIIAVAEENGVRLDIDINRGGWKSYNYTDANTTLNDIKKIVSDSGFKLYERWDKIKG
jgi:hypothetical protein